MKILMLGWEFPPYFTGGLGTVCHALSKALVNRDHSITYVMPQGPESLRRQNSFLNLRIANNEYPMKIRTVDSLLTMPYDCCAEYSERYVLAKKEGAITGKLYSGNLLAEVERFAQQALQIALTEDFDVIHAHDWMTFKAGLLIKKMTGKPLIVHVHITEFDKSGGEHADSRIYALEREGMMGADRVIAVSNFVKQRCINQYYVPGYKIRVIHNSVNFDNNSLLLRETTIKPHEKIILFLGRITLQKGPEYFLRAAKKVSELDPNIKFIMAGSGDMLPKMIELAAELGIGHKVIFPGFVPREQADALFRMADVFVMPSVSEPFGLVPLESMSQGTPTIISRQSGVSEVLTHTLKTDFWDTHDMANKMIAAIHYRALNHTLKEHGLIEIQTFNWDTPAHACEQTYEELINQNNSQNPGVETW